MRISISSLVYTLVLLNLYIRYASCIAPANSSFSATAASSSFLRGSHFQPPPSGIQAALECWAQWDAYSTSSTNCPKTTITGSAMTFTNRVESTIDKTFKLCDGHPRAVATGGERTSTSLGEQSGTPYTTYTIVLPPSGVPVATERTLVTTTITSMETTCASPVPTPKCSIGNDDCKALFSSWTAGSYSRLRPPCTYAFPKDPCDGCAIYVPSVKLMYFPVSMTGDFCGSYSTVTPTPSPNLATPTTVEISGTTFTSGLAYLSYAGVTAFGPSGTCGTTVGPGILPIPSSDVSSYRGHAAAMPIMGDIQWPFNFADLAPNPVPWDAWISQETCYTHQDYPTCQTITQAAYRPWIVYPHAFWSLDPRWSNCGSGIFGIMDPPTALPLAHEIVSPTWATATGDPTSTAAPKQDPGQSGPIQTSAVRSTPVPKHSDEPAQDVSMKHVSTSVLSTTGSSIGIPDNSPSPEDTTMLSAGEGITNIRPFASLQSHTRVSEQPASTTRSDNALSVLEAAATQGQPNAEFTLGGQVYTAYPGGLVKGGEDVIVLSPHTPTTMAGHVLSMGGGKLWFDSTTLTFTPANGADSRTGDPGSLASHPAGKSQDAVSYTSLPRIVSADRSVGLDTITPPRLPTSHVGSTTKPSGSVLSSKATKSVAEPKLVLAILAVAFLI